MNNGIIGVNGYRYKIQPYLLKKSLFKDFAFRCKRL